MSGGNHLQGGRCVSAEFSAGNFYSFDFTVKIICLPQSIIISIALMVIGILRKFIDTVLVRSTDHIEKDTSEKTLDFIQAHRYASSIHQLRFRFGFNLLKSKLLNHYSSNYISMAGKDVAHSR